MIQKLRQIIELVRNRWFHSADRPQRRQGARSISVLHLAILKRVSGQLEAVRVRNLSANGLMFEPNAPVQVGERVVFKLKYFGDVAAQVRWSHGSRAGVAFDAPIALEIGYSPEEAEAEQAATS